MTEIFIGSCIGSVIGILITQILTTKRLSNLQSDFIDLKRMVYLDRKDFNERIYELEVESLEDLEEMIVNLRKKTF